MFAHSVGANFIRAQFNLHFFFCSLLLSFARCKQERFVYCSTQNSRLDFNIIAALHQHIQIYRRPYLVVPMIISFQHSWRLACVCFFLLLLLKFMHHRIRKLLRVCKELIVLRLRRFFFCGMIANCSHFLLNK